MAKCLFCGEPGVAYLHAYRKRKKVATGFLCIKHSLMAYGLIELGQSSARKYLAQALGLKTGSVPRFKVSVSP